MNFKIGKERTTDMTKERPIIFSGEMVKAILDGRKTRTRRLIRFRYNDMQVTKEYRNKEYKHKDITYIRSEEVNTLGMLHLFEEKYESSGKYFSCPYGKVGSKLWVRETWDTVKEFDKDGDLINETPLYKAEHHTAYDKWKSPLFMPRWASRITLEITDIRVERLQEISKEDAKAEGVIPIVMKCKTREHELYRLAFIELWNSLQAKKGYAWKTNPFVWVISFRRIKP